MMMSQLLINGITEFIPMNTVIDVYYINIINMVKYKKFNTYLNFFDIKIINIERYLNMIDCIKVLDIILLDLRYKELSKSYARNQEFEDIMNILIIDFTLYAIIQIIIKLLE